MSDRVNRSDCDFANVCRILLSLITNDEYLSKFSYVLSKSNKKEEINLPKKLQNELRDDSEDGITDVYMRKILTDFTNKKNPPLKVVNLETDTRDYILDDLLFGCGVDSWVTNPNEAFCPFPSDCMVVLDSQLKIDCQAIEYALLRCDVDV
jgi:hypothetical protein